MRMKEAGWFIVRGTNRQVIAVCLYCKQAFNGWNDKHDPHKVHEVLSPECIFISNLRFIERRSPSIIESVTYYGVPPSLHNMAQLPKRIKSFEQWPRISSPPSAKSLAEAGFFYAGNNTTIECFFCNNRIRIVHGNENFMSAHTNQCKYAEHLRNHPRRDPLNIHASDKIYQLFDISKNSIKFYFLQCINASTPDILLSALGPVPNTCESQTSNRILKRLLKDVRFTQKINRATSSDGSLVHILNELAHNPVDLRTRPANIRSLIETSSIPTALQIYNIYFQCKACLTHDASPHAVPMKCGHGGLCLKECFLKWMTCVECGYPLGKTMRIHDV